MNLIEQLLEILAGRPLLRRKDLARHFNVSLDTIDRWRDEGRLPRPVYLHGKGTSSVPMWKPCDIMKMEGGANEPAINSEEKPSGTR